MYLADMVRGDLFDPKFGDTLIERYLNEKGGTYWPNAFSTSPDTPRGITALLTGNYSKINGVDMRGLDLRTSVRESQTTLFKSLVTQGIPVGVWRSKDEIDLGVWLPGDCLDYVEQFSTLDEMLHWSKDKETFLLYRHDNTYHSVMDKSLGTFLNPHKLGMELIFPNFLETINSSEFDFIWFFSDHGCKFSNESNLPLNLLDRHRTNIPLFLIDKKNFDCSLDLDLRLCALMDLYPTIHNQFGLSVNEKKISGLDLQGDYLHNEIWIDDYSVLDVKENELPDIYAKRTLNKLTVFYEAKFWSKNENMNLWFEETSDYEQLKNEMSQKFTFFDRIMSVQNRSQKIKNFYSTSNGSRAIKILNFIDIYTRFIRKYIFKLGSFIFISNLLKLKFLIVYKVNEIKIISELKKNTFN